MIKGVIVGSITGFSTHCAIRENDSIPDTLFSPMAETGRDPLPPIGSFGGQAWTGPCDRKTWLGPVGAGADEPLRGPRLRPKRLTSKGW